MTSPTPLSPPPLRLDRLRDFVRQLAAITARGLPEADTLAQARPLLHQLVAHDDWLPPDYAQPHPERYQQYLLHADALGRFSVVSFVWGPGQATPVHDHTVWGLIGMLRGAESSQPYAKDAQGRWQPQGHAHLLHPGDVEAVSPTLGDVHRVSNALPGQTSISIHVYGANIGAVRRHVYTDSGEAKPFISGYSNTHLPNLWDESRATLASA